MVNFSFVVGYEVENAATFVPKKRNDAGFWSRKFLMAF